MNKIWLIIQREYTSRVKNKRFLIITFLLPLMLVGFIAGSVYLSMKGTETRKIAVIDPNGFFKTALKSSDQLKFSFPDKIDTNNYSKNGYTDILILPNFEKDEKKDYLLRSKKSMGLMMQQDVVSKINNAIEDKMLQEAGIQKTYWIPFTKLLNFPN
jgi:ABC-2 type transport system permease protein